MTQETRDVLYNKQAHELNKNDIKLINTLINKNDSAITAKVLSVFGSFAGLTASLFLEFLFQGPINLVSAISCTGIGLLVGGVYGSFPCFVLPSLKFLGLTREDWKELKKSGRIKELKQIVKLYEQSDKSYLDDLAEREEEISSEIQLKEEEKQSLINELVDLYAEKRAITDEEKTPKYTQEYVAELLKSEENLLMRRLNQLKQEQEMLKENADNKTIIKSGKRAEQSIDYMKQALKNCQEFNEEFKGETFDN